jgi:hypothetical protein
MNDDLHTDAAGVPRRLDQVQRWLQAVITHPGGVAAGVDSAEAQQEISVSQADVESVIGRSLSLTSLERLAVYGDAYYARLVECLRDVFPILTAAMGEVVFNSFAYRYLQRYPSQSYTLNELGRHFADYLFETRPAGDAAKPTELPAEWPRFLVDVATLEWAIGSVFDGPGLEKQEPLSAQRLAAVAPDDWPRARIVLSPALRLLAFQFPVNDFYSQMRDYAAALDEVRERREHGKTVDDLPDSDVPMPAPTKSYLALVRRDYVVRRHPLNATQFALLTALSQGATVEAAIAAAVQESPLADEELAELLRTSFARWAADQFFAAVVLPDDAPRTAS